MTILAAAMLAFLAQGQSGGTIDNPAYHGTADNSGERRSIQDLEFVKPSPERVEAYVRQMFDNWDRDGSGYVEKAEAPEWLSVPKPGRLAPGELPEYIELEGDAARAQYVENVDKDDDGKVSYDEYAGPVRPQFLERGIPLIPADWTGAPANRDETAESGLEPALSRGRVMPTPVEMRLMIATSFAHLDADGSGYMEGNEGPVSTPQGPQPVFRYDESGKLVDTGERVTRTVEELRANFYRAADRDGDARVSRAEFEPWAIKNLLLTGISPEFRQAVNAPIKPQS